jgi:uncharacterized protein YndB with AHSA1/START domain
MNEDKLLDTRDVFPEEIRFASQVRCSRHECYAAITNAEKWNAWFTTGMFMDLKIGGVIVFDWQDWGADHISTGDHGLIIEIVQDQNLAFTWHPDKPGYTTRVDISLEDDPAGCIVRVCEQGFANNAEGMHAMLQSAVGWGEALTLFKMFMEHGIRY